MTDETTYDLVIVGAGPAGYTAAVKAAQSGMKTACIDRSPRPGGVCLNVGCIPSKTLLDSSALVDAARNKMADHGIELADIRVNLSKMMARKETVINQLTGQVKKLLDTNHVTLIQGNASLSAPDQVDVIQEDGILHLKTRFILLAGGSHPVTIPGLNFDGNRIVDSTGALQFDEVPRHLAIVGGGYIGLELGLVWKRLGSRATVIEMLPQIAGSLDGQISRTLKLSLTRQGIEFMLKTRVVQASAEDDHVTLTLESGGKAETVICDRVLVAAGRKPATANLGLETAGVKTDSKTGFIQVNASYQTRVPNIYAAGDMIPGPMLAHKASAEGIAAVDAMNGIESDVNYDTIPSVIYTWPEVGSVGLTEEQVKARNIPYRSAAFPYTGNGRALCLGETDGLVKLIAHARTDRILGIHIIGPHASEIIGECTMAMEFGASAEDMARVIHSHPTFSEAVMDAARAMTGRS
jgi:dihydrolipoamide dehydrogenase